MLDLTQLLEVGKQMSVDFFSNTAVLGVIVSVIASQLTKLGTKIDSSTQSAQVTKVMQALMGALTVAVSGVSLYLQHKLGTVDYSSLIYAVQVWIAALASHAAGTSAKTVMGLTKDGSK